MAHRAPLEPRGRDRRSKSLAGPRWSDECQGGEGCKMDGSLPSGAFWLSMVVNLGNLPWILEMIIETVLQNRVGRFKFMLHQVIRIWPNGVFSLLCLHTVPYHDYRCIFLKEEVGFSATALRQRTVRGLGGMNKYVFSRIFRNDLHTLA